MAIFGSLVALLKSDNRQWSRGFNDAGKDVDKLKGKTSSFFKDLKSSFGKGSTLGQSLKLAAGGGAIAGLSLAGRELKNFADELVQIKSDFNAGTISAGEMAEKVASSIPVFGQFFQAGRSIRELFTGEAAEVARINHETERTNAIIDDQLTMRKQVKQSLADEAAEIRRINREIEKNGKGPFDRRKIDIAQQGDDTQRQRAKEKQAELDELMKDDPAFKKEVKERDAMQAKLSELKAASEDITPVYFGGHGQSGALSALEEYNKLKDEFDKLNPMVEKDKQARADRLKEIDAKYKNLAKKDAEKNLADETQVDIELAQEKQKATDAAQDRIRKEQQDLKIQKLKEDGKEEQAAIQAIEDEVTNAKIQNIRDAQEKLKGMGLTEESDFGKQLMGNVGKQNEALDNIADSKIQEYRDGRRKELVDSIGDPLRKYQQEVEKWNSEVKQGIVTRAEADAAIAKLHKELEESLGAKESPIDKLREEIAELQKGVELRLIDPDKAKAAINALTEEAMPKVDYRAAESRPMRFAGRVQSHPWPDGGPMDDLRKTALAQLEEQKRIRKATEDAAKNSGAQDVVVTIPG